MSTLADEAVFTAPRTLDEVYDVLERFGGSATLLSGGMTLLPMLNRGIGSRDRIVSLGRVTGLDDVALVRADGTGAARLRIGATATHTVLATHPLVLGSARVLAQAAAGIGDLQVRNRGTIGGVVAYGNAGADYLTVLSALDATVLIGRAGGERRAVLDDFLLGLRRTDLRRGEVVIGLEIAGDAPDAAAFQRYYRVQGAAPTITAAAVGRPGSTVLAVGGATPTPTVVRLGDDAGARERALAVIDAACLADPFGDPHDPPAYRRAMAALHARRVLEETAA